MNESIVIVGAARTPLGAFQGALATLAASDLGAVAVRAAVERAGIAPDRIDQVILGNCLMAGQGQAPARQAMIKAGLPASTGAVTLSRLCGSGMQALMFAHDSLIAGTHDVIVAGGMESMSQAPYLIPRSQAGQNPEAAVDHMMRDGLEDAYEPQQNMGHLAEACAARYQFSRDEQDAYARTSVMRAQAAVRDGSSRWEIAPVTVKGAEGPRLIEDDEPPHKARIEKIPALKPAFKEDGTITAASSSKLADGAAALIVMRESTARELGCTPLARIVAHASHALEPHWFTTAPVGALTKLYRKTGWRGEEVDLFEVNEAFAAVPMVAMREHAIPHDRMNIHGGACALGHPLGASGARIIVTLLAALRKTGGRRGIAAICIGGGEATAVAIERI